MGASVCRLEDGGDSVTFERKRFAQGEYRNAYLGQRKGRRVVVKAYKKKYMIDEDLDTDLQMHALARELAEEFSKKPLAGKMKVECLLPEAAVVEAVGCMSAVRVGERVMVEPFVAGKYRKFVSNNGTFLPGNGLLTAFCHWTFHKTHGKVMLVDAQGVLKHGKYILTDPAFHSKDGRFGDLDLGEVGMQAFFKLHRCTDACSKLRRPKAINFDWKDCERIMKERVSRSKVAPSAGGSVYRHQ